jgi:large subunit ribosomal protein L25
MEAILEAQSRDTFGKNEARRIRREGKVPAVLYGGDKNEATPIVVAPKALLKILHSQSGLNTLISLKLAGAGDARVLVKDFQVDPITHAVLHADFYRIAMDKTLQVTIPIVVHGEPKGVKQQGGVLEFIRREIVIEVLPADIPEHVELDVTALAIGHSMFVRDVRVEKAEILNDPDTPVCTVVAPRTEEAPAPVEEAAAPTEPELIRKPKPDAEAEAEPKA